MTAQDVKHRARELHAAGHGLRKIARALSLSRNTVRSILREPIDTDTPVPQTERRARAMIIDPFREQIRVLAETVDKQKNPLTTTMILKELRHSGYTGGRTAVGDLVREIRGSARIGRRVWRRFETLPAEEAQQDWSPYRVEIAGKIVVIQLFSLILSWSRFQFLRAFPDQQLTSLLQGHVDAFHYFAGVPWRIVYDNQKTITPFWIDGKAIITEKFGQFAKHYGFEPVVCLPGHKERKGKVERPFWYVERSFFPLKTFTSLDQLNEKLIHWLDGQEDPLEGNLRRHGTTREVPHERWLREKELLYGLPTVDRVPRRIEPRIVNKDATISVRQSRYSVPARLVEAGLCEVWVSIGARDLVIYDKDGNRLAEHTLTTETGKLVIDETHYQGLSPRRAHRRRPGIEEKLVESIPEARAFLDAMKKAAGATYSIHLRAIAELLDRYGAEQIAQALARAIADGSATSGYVRALLAREHPTALTGRIETETPRGLDLGSFSPGDSTGYARIFTERTPDAPSSGDEKKSSPPKSDEDLGAREHDKIDVDGDDDDERRLT
jgi:transposase